MDGVFTWIIGLGVLGVLLLAAFGVVPWDLTFALFTIITCGGELARVVVKRARRGTAD